MSGKATMRPGENQIIVPLHAEQFTVERLPVVTGRARVSIVTRQHEDWVEALLVRERVEIERRPIGRAVEQAPAIREEGEVLIIPVMEEALVVERRLVLKEEIRIRRIRETERHQERVNLRKQEAIIARFPAQQQAAAPIAAGVEPQIARKEK